MLSFSFSKISKLMIFSVVMKKQSLNLKRVKWFSSFLLASIAYLNCSHIFFRVTRNALTSRANWVGRCWKTRFGRFKTLQKIFHLSKRKKHFWLVYVGPKLQLWKHCFTLGVHIAGDKRFTYHSMKQRLD